MGVWISRVLIKNRPFFFLFVFFIHPVLDSQLLFIYLRFVCLEVFIFDNIESDQMLFIYSFQFRPDCWIVYFLGIQDTGYGIRDIGSDCLLFLFTCSVFQFSHSNFNVNPETGEKCKNVLTYRLSSTNEIDCIFFSSLYPTIKSFSS